MICVLVLSRNTDVNIFTYKAIDALTDLDTLSYLSVKGFTNVIYKLL